MARVEALVLCRYAEVNSGMVTIVSGGVTRAFVAEVPSTVDPLYAAGMLYIPPDEVGLVLEVRLCIKMVDQAAKIAEIVGALHVAGADMHPGEGLHVPIVLPLSRVPFPSYGQVDVQLLVNNQVGADLTFWITPRPPDAGHPPDS